MTKLFLLMMVVCTVGCGASTEVCFDETDPDEAAEVEVAVTTKTVRDDATAAGEGARATAECPADHHVKRGWCWFGHKLNNGAPAFDAVPVVLNNRTSMHAPQSDGWQCAGTAGPDAAVRITAWVECESGGGMEQKR